VTKINHEVTSGIIVETEAYSEKERGSHAFKGMTKRTEVMFEQEERHTYIFAMVCMKCSM